MSRWLPAVLLAGSLATGAAAETMTVFAANYDLKLSAGDSASQIRSSARVRAGHVIPLEMSQHRVDLAFSQESDETIRVQLQLYEKSRGSWYRIDTGTLQFAATPEVPVEYTWSGGGLEIDLALVVSRET